MMPIDVAQRRVVDAPIGVTAQSAVKRVIIRDVHDPSIAPSLIPIRQARNKGRERGREAPSEGRSPSSVADSPMNFL